MNLNSPATPVSPSLEHSKPSGSGGLSIEGAEPQPILNGEPDADGSTPTAGKRKLRTSRIAEGRSKRSRVATNTAGTSAKDHSPPTARLSDLGGVESCIEKMLELVAMPLCHPEVYLHTGVQPPRGVLLHGGCGKMLLARAIARVSWISIHNVYYF